MQDFDGGQVSTVTYGSKDPITKTLKSFSIDLTANPSLAELLEPDPRRARGAGGADGVHRRHPGRRETQAGVEQPDTIEVDVLNLLTDTGLRAMPLEPSAA